MNVGLVDIIESSCFGTLVFLMLLCIKRPVEKCCGAGAWHHFLMVDALFFLLPIFPLMPALSKITQPLRIWLANAMLPPPTEQFGIYTTKAPNYTLQGILIAVWIAGAIISLGVFLGGHVAFILRNKNKFVAAPSRILSIYDHGILQGAHPAKARSLKGVRMFMSDGISTPLSYGLIKKMIILPDDVLEHYDDDELLLMLLHESKHIEHGDSWKQLFVMLARAAHWFNPAIHYLTHSVSASIEFRCDEKMISNCDNDEARYKYGELLLNMVSDVREHSLIGRYFSNKKLIVQRIKLISIDRKKKKVSVVLFTMLIAAFAMLTVMGIAVVDGRTPITHDLGFIDYGEECEPITIPQLVPSENAYYLYLSGDYVYEGILYAGLVNYVPDSFITDTGLMTVSLDSGRGPIEVVLSYADNIDYPIMHFYLNKRGQSKSFMVLSVNFEYSLSFVVDADTKDAVRLTVSG
ncbi:MAG: M56 family metallopeptidase [Oscillospiraceae bacterium]|nr:M56 family metallopeptidase [Oscillospiraceae bacterium]